MGCIQGSLSHKRSKTTEIHTYVTNRDMGRTKRSLDVSGTNYKESECVDWFNQGDAYQKYLDILPTSKCTRTGSDMNQLSDAFLDRLLKQGKKKEDR